MGRETRGARNGASHGASCTHRKMSRSVPWATQMVHRLDTSHEPCSMWLSGWLVDAFRFRRRFRAASLRASQAVVLLAHIGLGSVATGSP